MIDQQRTGKSAIREPIYCLRGAGRPRSSVHRMRMLRTSRLLVIGLLVAGGLTALAPGANASVPSVSKTCRSLNSLNQNLQKALASGDSGQIDTGAISNLSKSFRKAEKTSPKSLKSAENTIADAAASVSHTSDAAAAAAAIKAAGSRLTAAVVTLGTYIGRNCSGATPSTT